VEFINRSSTLHFRPVAQIIIDADVVGHLGPPVVAGYELKGLEVACMSGNVHIMVLLNNMTPKVLSLGT
jgi:hypothetical protein